MHDARRLRDDGNACTTDLCTDAASAATRRPDPTCVPCDDGGRLQRRERLHAPTSAPRASARTDARSDLRAVRDGGRVRRRPGLHDRDSARTASAATRLRARLHPVRDERGLQRRQRLHDRRVRREQELPDHHDPRLRAVQDGRTTATTATPARPTPAPAGACSARDDRRVSAPRSATTGVDNDGDGAVDCADTDCVGHRCLPGRDLRQLHRRRRRRPRRLRGRRLLRPERGARAAQDALPHEARRSVRTACASRHALRKAPPMASRRACPARRSSSATSTAQFFCQMIPFVPNAALASKGLYKFKGQDRNARRRSAGTLPREREEVAAASRSAPRARR